MTTAKQDAVRADEKARRRKLVQDREVASKTIEKGLLLVNTGAGKGKSTAAFGLAVRALGQGMGVAVVQFIKGAWKTGEAEFFGSLGEPFASRVDFYPMGEGFTWETQNRLRDIKVAKKAWRRAAQLIKKGGGERLVILDELNILLRYGYLDTDEVLRTLTARPRMLHVAVTGRAAHPKLIEVADMVTEMKPIKHHYQAGVKAQKGIEF